MAESALSRRISEFVGVALFAVALIWLISLVTHESTDPAWFFTTNTTHPPVNFVGRVGAFLSELSFQVLGYAAYLIPVIIGAAGWQYFWCHATDAIYTKILGIGLLLGCVSTFLSLALGTSEIASGTFQAGGSFGGLVADSMANYLNKTGAIIIDLTLMMLALLLSTQLSLGRLFATITKSSWENSTRGIEIIQAWIKQRRQDRQRREVVAKHTKKKPAKIISSEEKIIKTQPTLEIKPKEQAAKPTLASQGLGSLLANKKESSEEPKLPLSEPTQTKTKTAQRNSAAYVLPPLSLLDPPKAAQKIDDRELMEAAKQLEDKCREFAVEGQVVQIHPGPIVTTFEFKPDAGVKYNKITGLAEDLCLAMQAESVLIERIPGKSTVGIQIPNSSREIISLRSLLESDAYQLSTSKISLTLGKTIHGDPHITDLGTMPHLLIAGSTGTGKSVGINAMLTSILYRATPNDVRLILIDPKRLELGMYDEIPHLLTPVVVEPKKASNALRWAVREMEERYKTLAAEGVRNIQQYNRNIREILEDRRSDDPDTPQPLPFIVVVIDELADLMMVAKNEVEESIARLAQMARAVGIHLILATQRPSVDVITGLIKANFPSRISFRVSSKIDSRTILDSNGAEQLLGKGDMLFLPPASSRCIRLHGPYISEQESARLASFLRKQGAPVFDETITADAEQSGPDGIELEKDDLYDEAARIVVGTRQASISFLQRKLRIGFSRAARLVDMMEVEGLVSQGTGGKSREVLVEQNYFEEVDAQLR